jgi:hypothetical protein
MIEADASASQKVSENPFMLTILKLPDTRGLSRGQYEFSQLKVLIFLKACQSVKSVPRGSDEGPVR